MPNCENILRIASKKLIFLGGIYAKVYCCYISRPSLKIALGSTKTFHDLTNAFPASVPIKLTMAFRSDTSIFAT
jgi:hypothetical protein